jgi:tetratricopeptide (TPR) repeat protein
MLPVKKNKSWNNTSTVVVVVTLGIIGFLGGMNNYLKNNRLGSVVTQKGDEQINVVLKTVPAETVTDSDENIKLFNLGIKYINSKDWKSAQDAFKNYFNNSGGNPLAYYFLGYSMRKTGDVLGAKENLNKCIENTKPKQSPFRVSAGIELMFTLLKMHTKEDFLLGLNVLNQLDSEAETSDGFKKDSFVGAGYALIYNYGKLVLKSNPEEGHLMLERLFKPIAGKPRTTVAILLRSYFLRNREYIIGEIKSGRVQNAIKGWKDVSENEKYIFPVLTASDKAAFNELKQEIQNLPINQSKKS